MSQATIIGNNSAFSFQLNKTTDSPVVSATTNAVYPPYNYTNVTAASWWGSISASGSDTIYTPSAALYAAKPICFVVEAIYTGTQFHLEIKYIPPSTPGAISTWVMSSNSYSNAEISLGQWYNRFGAPTGFTDVWTLAITNLATANNIYAYGNF